MTTTMTKARLLAELQEEQAAWETLLQGIDEKLMTEPGVAGEWSLKDVIVHLSGWRRRTISRFQAALHHQPVPAPFWPAELQTDDEINAWMVASASTRSVSEVLQEDHDVFQQLFEAVSAFPEAELLDPQRFDWIEGEPLTGALFFGHLHDEHEHNIQAWLSKHQQSASTK